MRVHENMEICLGNTKTEVLVQNVEQSMEETKKKKIIAARMVAGKKEKSNQRNCRSVSRSTEDEKSEIKGKMETTENRTIDENRQKWKPSESPEATEKYEHLGTLEN